MSVRSRSTGFTLVEVLVVAAILGILATLASLAVFHGTSRVRVSNAAFEVGALYTAARMRATSMGVPHYVVFHDDGTDFGVYLLERADSLGAFDWASGDVMTATTVGGIRHEQLRLSSEGGLGFLDLGAPRADFRMLPAPFAAISLTPSGSGQLLGGCTFCTEGMGGARSVIRFSPDGTVRVMTGGAEAGGVVAFAPDARGGRFSIGLLGVLHMNVLASQQNGLGRRHRGPPHPGEEAGQRVPHRGRRGLGHGRGAPLRAGPDGAADQPGGGPAGPRPQPEGGLPVDVAVAV